MTYQALVLFSMLCASNILITCSTILQDLHDFDSNPSIRGFQLNSTSENAVPYPVLFRNARQTVPCRKGRWQCKNGECIRKDQLCDGEVNCKDASDETFVQCRNTPCQSHLFRCTYGACADSDARCNGQRNCADNSDEDNKICSPRPKQDKCGEIKFQCNNGDCIGRTKVCDGIADCKDGSDETIHQCSDNKCLAHLFKCAYGACADGDAACDNKIDCYDLSDELPDLCRNESGYNPSIYLNAQRVSTVAPVTSAPTTQSAVIPAEIPKEGACIVPSNPTNGIYSYNNKSPEPGEQIPNLGALLYLCNNNYVPSTPHGIAYCIDGSWQPEKVECYKLCRNLTSITVDYTCTYKGENIPCMNMQHDTVVTATCKNGHIENSRSKLKRLRCLKGQWDYPENNCVAECGEEVSTATPLIVGGKVATNYTSPWHVAIYDKTSKSHVYICGGTIITNKIVISAAHCFDRGNVGNLSPASEYAVAAGKRIRTWEAVEDTVQKFGILQIIKHERYLGFSSNLQNDIAILILDKIVAFNDFVHPACLEQTNIKFKNTQIAPGNYGQVVGWGLTKEGDQKSLADYLMIAKLPVVDYNTCKANMKSSFQKYLSNDKLCAGYLNGTTVCQGDSGGGLVFPADEQGTTRYYLRAIVSVGDFDETGTTCKKDAYVAFTDVWSQNSLISESLENN